MESAFPWHLATTTLSILMGLAASPSMASEAIAPNPQLAQGNESFRAQPVQLAQAGETCYQVSIEGGTYIQEEPDVYSGVRGSVYYGQTITVAPGGTEDWAYITAPTRGYVWADWLIPCRTALQVSSTESTTTTTFELTAAPEPGRDICRLVVAENGVPVLPEPSITGQPIGTIPGGQRVTVERREADYWVSILAPIPGYIAAENIAGCP